MSASPVLVNGQLIRCDAEGVPKIVQRITWRYDYRKLSGGELLVAHYFDGSRRVIPRGDKKHRRMTRERFMDPDWATLIAETYWGEGSYT